MKAETPSAKSGDWEEDTIKALSNSNWVSKNVDVEASRSCFVDLRLFLDHFPQSFAVFIEHSNSPSEEVTSSTAPNSRASLAVYTSLLKKNFLLIWLPTSLGSNHVVPPSGDAPNPKKAAAIFACSEHIL